MSFRVPEENRLAGTPGFNNGVFGFVSPIPGRGLYCIVSDGEGWRWHFAGMFAKASLSAEWAINQAEALLIELERGK